MDDLERFANSIPGNLTRVNRDDNLTVEQRGAIDTFKNRKNILFFVADKGSSVVLLNEAFYRVKVLEVLNTPKYEKLNSNIDRTIFSKLKTLVKSYKNILF